MLGKLSGVWKGGWGRKGCWFAGPCGWVGAGELSGWIGWIADSFTLEHSTHFPTFESWLCHPSHPIENSSHPCSPPLRPPSRLSSISVPPSHGTTAKSKFISAKSLICSRRCCWPYISLSAVSVRSSFHLTNEAGSSSGAGTLLRSSQCEWRCLCDVRCISSRV